VNTSLVKPADRLEEAEKHIRIVAASLSMLRQMNERLELPTRTDVLDELVALARAQRRTLKATQAQLEADPLFAHLLKSRIAYYRDGVASVTKPMVREHEGRGNHHPPRREIKGAHGK
jgi:hypothetical protein